METKKGWKIQPFVPLFPGMNDARRHPGSRDYSVFQVRFRVRGKDAKEETSKKTLTACPCLDIISFSGV